MWVSLVHRPPPSFSKNQQREGRRGLLGLVCGWVEVTRFPEDLSAFAASEFQLNSNQACSRNGLWGGFGALFSLFLRDSEPSIRVEPQTQQLNRG